MRNIAKPYRKEGLYGSITKKFWQIVAISTSTVYKERDGPYRLRSGMLSALVFNKRSSGKNQGD